jgi:hypothetical protein
MEAQYGRSIGHGKISVDRCRSRYCTYMNLNKRLGKVGWEGEDHNLIVSLRFSITKYAKGSYDQGFME